MPFLGRVVGRGVKRKGGKIGCEEKMVEIWDVERNFGGVIRSSPKFSKLRKYPQMNTCTSQSARLTLQENDSIKIFHATNNGQIRISDQCVPATFPIGRLAEVSTCGLP